MGKRVEVTRSLASSSSFARQVEAAAAKQAVKKLRAVTDDATVEANRLIAQKLVIDRGKYRHKEGTRHLYGSVKVEVEWDGRSFPVTLVAKAIGNQKKIGALEYGSPPHVITARNAPTLAITSTKGVATEIGRGGAIVRLESGNKPSARAQSQARTSNNPLSRSLRLAKPVSVNHPGNRAYGFLRGGLEKAVQKAFGSAR